MSETHEPGPRLVLQAASRRFGELLAVDSLDLQLVPGQLHAIIGENGAGKSTALKLLAGALAPSSGSVRIADEALQPATPAEATRRGVGMVHQHFMLIDDFSALENVMLGHEPTRSFGRLDTTTAEQRATAVAQAAGLDVDLSRRCGDLSVGERQRLEIVRVLFRGARALLLDEPSAVLSPPEVVELYATLRDLANKGATIAVVTHRLDEVVRYCDAVTVLRRGRKVLAAEITSQDQAGQTERLTRAIMGGDPPRSTPLDEPPEDAPIRLKLVDLATAAQGGHGGLAGLSVALRSGEVVGIAGIEGNGQSELAAVLAGLHALRGGHVEIAGKRLFGTNSGSGAQAVRRARLAGMLVVHADRQRDEMIGQATVADNLVLADLPSYADAAAEYASMLQRFKRFAIQPRDPQRLGAELSGGNQQKLVMARALDRQLSVLVLDQPTRGVDIGSAAAIHRVISQAAEEGVAVLLISADLNELRSLSHRLLVMRRGRIVARLPRDADDETVGRAMLGVTTANDDPEAA